MKYEGARRALELKLGSLQLDVHDHSAGWRSALGLDLKKKYPGGEGGKDGRKDDM